MRNSIVRRHVILAALLVLCVACQSAGNPHGHSSPKPTVAPTVTPDPQRCARLAKRGFTPCPPLASQLKLPPTTIKNATDGAVDETTVQRWVRAFQLGQAYYYWVMDQNARDVLTSGVLADEGAASNLFGIDLKDLDQAKQKGGILKVVEFAMPITQVVVVPTSLQQRMQVQGLIPKPFGLAVRFQGPASHTVLFPDGHKESLGSVGADFVPDTLVWGELRSDPELGEIWYESGFYGCEEIRSVCRL